MKVFGSEVTVEQYNLDYLKDVANGYYPASIDFCESEDSNNGFDRAEAILNLLDDERHGIFIKELAEFVVEQECPKARHMIFCEIESMAARSRVIGIKNLPTSQKLINLGFFACEEAEFIK